MISQIETKALSLEDYRCGAVMKRESEKAGETRVNLFIEPQFDLIISIGVCSDSVVGLNPVIHTDGRGRTRHHRLP
jgi:hypothetical protein